MSFKYIIHVSYTILNGKVLIRVDEIQSKISILHKYISLTYRTKPSVYYLNIR